MYEARITYVSGRKHTVEASTLEMLKTKCEPFINDNEILLIWVCKIESVGFYKGLMEDLKPQN
jgi:hypothetical protein